WNKENSTLPSRSRANGTREALTRPLRASSSRNIGIDTATYDAASRPTTFPAMAVRPAAALPTLLSNRACSPTGIGRSASPHFAYVPGLKVGKRESTTSPICPDGLTTRSTRPTLICPIPPGRTPGRRRALALLDDAINLVGVLLAAVEQDADTRGAQAFPL